MANVGCSTYCRHKQWIHNKMVYFGTFIIGKGAIKKKKINNWIRYAAPLYLYFVLLGRAVSLTVI